MYRINIILMQLTFLLKQNNLTDLNQTLEPEANLSSQLCLNSKRKYSPEAIESNSLEEGSLESLPKRSKVFQIELATENAFVEAKEKRKEFLEQKVFQVNISEELNSRICEKKVFLHDHVRNILYSLERVEFDHISLDKLGEMQNIQDISLNGAKSICPNFSQERSTPNKLNLETSTTNENTEDEPLEVKNTPDNTYLFPYRIEKQQEDLHRIKYSTCIFSKYYQLFYNMQNDYSIKLLYLVNIFSDKFKVATNNCNYISLQQTEAFSEFYKILSCNYKIELINDVNKIELKDLFEEFQNFEKFLNGKYKFERIEPKYNKCFIHYNSYVHIKDKFSNKSHQNIIQYHIDIFESYNYKLLVAVLPSLQIILKMKHFPKTKRFSVAVIKYLQVILCKFEVFRHEYFCKKNITKESLKVLYSDENFNETIAIISKILSKVIYAFYGMKNSKIILILRILDFFYFVRAKFNYIFQAFISDKFFEKADCFEKEIFTFNIDESGNLITFDFTEKFVSTSLYKRLIKIILEDNV